MSPLTRSVILSALLSLAAGSAGAAVTVAFVSPDQYSDMPPFEADRHTVLKALDAHFQLLAQGLPPGASMTVDVLDLDLAGRIEPNRRLHDIRILKGMADWPSMHLRYRIEAQGKVLASGDDHISDMTYLDHLNRYHSGDPLRYEKKMIDDWFMRTVAARQVMGAPAN